MTETTVEQDARETLRLELARDSAKLESLVAEKEKASSWRTDLELLQKKQEKEMIPIAKKRAEFDAMGFDIAHASRCRNRLLAEFVPLEIQKKLTQASFKVREITLALKRATGDAVDCRKGIVDARTADKFTIDRENQRLFAFEAVAAEIEEDLERAKKAEAPLAAEVKRLHAEACRLG